MKKIPMRKCIGCMESRAKKELCRIVKTKEGKINVDYTGKTEGRGAYICYQVECLDKARKNRRLEKEFSMKIEDYIYEELRRGIESAK